MSSTRIDWSELFFSSSGRVARGPFLIAAAVIIVCLSLYEAAVTGPLHWITGWLVYPVLVFTGACVLSKRLHDRGRSGWWAAVVLFAYLMVWPSPQGVLDFLGLIVLIWAAIELALMPGEEGANRFGANPLRPVQA